MKQRRCEDPQFCLVLTESKFLPGTKAWKLVRVETGNESAEAQEQNR